MGEAAKEVLSAVAEAVGEGSRRLQRPLLLETDKRSVTICMGRDPLDNVEVELFEDDLAELTGMGHAVALSSGTAALHLALLAVGVQPGDEVLLPSLTFAATANAVVHAGAIPHFIDSRAQDLGINPYGLRQYLGGMGGGTFERRDHGLHNRQTDRRVGAIVPVHLLGMPCEVLGILGLCKAYNLPMVEDACEALGSVTWGGRWAGTVGQIGCFSFNLNKIVTTGGGGAIVTNDPLIASKIRHLASQAKLDHPFLWQHDRVGFNYRMPNICAALGLSQLRRIRRTLDEKENLFQRYKAAFQTCKTAKLVDGLGNRWLNCCLLDPRHMKDRDEVIGALLENGYEARALFTPMHMLDHFRGYPRKPMLSSSEDLHRRAICLPSSIS